MVVGGVLAGLETGTLLLVVLDLGDVGLQAGDQVEHRVLGMEPLELGERRFRELLDRHEATRVGVEETPEIERAKDAAGNFHLAVVKRQLTEVLDDVLIGIVTRLELLRAQALLEGLAAQQVAGNREALAGE